jgi:DNA polymerase-1
MNNLVIDGSNLLWRAHWVASTRDQLVNTKGEWTGPVYLFLKSLKSLSDKFRPDSVWVTWDKRLNYPSTNFRKLAAPETYKQNRDTEKTIKVHEQHEKLSEYLTALGIKQIYPWVLEADDIISWLCREKLTSSTIVTVDKDLLQLVNADTQYYNPIKKKLITINTFEQDVGIRVEKFVMYKALLGDKSDNIEGIQGYGIQRSTKLVESGNYDVVVNALNEDDKNKFDKNIELVNLFGSYHKEEGEVECYEKQYKELSELKPNMKKFEQLCLDAEFHSLIKDMDKWKQSFSRNSSLSSLISQLI